jgi:4,5-dihydroxyphthalate decarboxylase
MPHAISLTLACGDYDIVRALTDGSVEPEGIDLTIVTRMTASTRHWRFLRNREFDIAELSSSSYLIARDAGLAFDAIPVFLHRRFRHGFVFINTHKGIRTPRDLIGRRVGVKSFQVSAILWLRGILEHDYGVPHKSIEWFSEIDEDVDFVPPPDLRLTRLGHAQSVEAMLVTGELDALLHPNIIDPWLDKDPNVARLFPDYKQDEIAFYRNTGMFPIMHVMGLRRDIVERYPWVPASLFRAFDAAKAIAMRRLANSCAIPLAWHQHAWEEQEEILGPDPWEYGLTARNRKTLDTMVRFSHEQGLIRRAIPLEELFLDVAGT